MISNTTTITKKDYQSLKRFRRFSVRSVLFSLIQLTCGGYLVYMFCPIIYHLLTRHYYLSVISIVQTVTFTVLGLVFIFAGIFSERFRSNMLYKRAKSVAKRTYNFTDEGIETIVRSELMEQQDLFKYELMTRYYEMNNSLYIKLKIEKQKLFLIIHNDGYTSGSKEEVVALLESKGITSK